MSADPCRRLIMEPNEVGNGTPHPDGSPCLAGTKQIPRKYKPCCKDFEFRLTACQFDVRYEKNNRMWGILLPDGGSFIQIKFCPHCGAKL